MKKILSAFLILFCSTALADTKISQLPLVSSANVESGDSLPFVSNYLEATGRIALDDLPNMAAFQSAFLSSVGITAPSWLTVTGSPLTSNGTIAITGATELSNLFLASPNGTSGAMTPRAIVAADIPTLNQNTTGNAATATALASTPTQCGGSPQQFSTGIAASGNANCLAPPQGTVTSFSIAISAGGMTASVSNPNTTPAVTITPKAPTSQLFTSGSDTYTTPAGVLYIVVTVIGDGAGGAGANASSLSTAGSGTTFGTSLITAGGGGAANSATKGVGGTNTINAGPIVLINQPGSTGSDAAVVVNSAGGAGGGSMFYGGGGGSSANTYGANGATNSGGGGGGGGGASGVAGGGGGGGGGSVKAWILSPASTYPYSVGPGGAGSAPGSGGSAYGGAGAAGKIIVEEYYQ